MRVSLLAESPVDEAVLEVFVAHHVKGVTLVDPGRIRSRGWPGVVDVMRARLAQLTYGGTADLLVVLADSDESPFSGHLAGHPCANSECRLCRLESVVEEFGSANSRHRGVPEVLCGLPVPAIESWLLFGEHSSASEAAWMGIDASSRHEHKLNLKRALYGTDRAPIESMRERAVERARVIVTSAGLEDHFPVGLRPLFQRLRALS